MLYINLHFTYLLTYLRRCLSTNRVVLCLQWISHHWSDITRLFLIVNEAPLFNPASHTNSSQARLLKIGGCCRNFLCWKAPKFLIPVGVFLKVHSTSDARDRRLYHLVRRRMFNRNTGGLYSVLLESNSRCFTHQIKCGRFAQQSTRHCDDADRSIISQSGS